MLKFIKNHKKITATVCFVLIIGLGLLFDLCWSKTYELSVVSITPDKPVANARQPVEIVLELSHFGKPVEGHSLFCLAEDGGTMKENVLVTDENGRAVYVYYPYNETLLMPAKPVNFYCHDENNSIFFEINTSVRFVINLQSRNSRG